MDEVLPREIMRGMLVVSPLGAFNALARSCSWLRAHAASVAVSYADSVRVVNDVNDVRLSYTLHKLPNGVRHGTSRVNVNGAKITATYDRGRVVGICRAICALAGSVTFLPGGFVELGEGVCVAYGATSSLILSRMGPHWNLILRTEFDAPQHRVIASNINKPAWKLDSVDDHTAAEAWFARYMIETPAGHRLIETVCVQNVPRIELVRALLPGLI